MNLLLKIWKLLPLSKSFQLALMRLMQDQFLVGVSGIIFNDKNEVLLFKHSYRQTPWSMPGGYLKGREHPKEGLEREVLEESGFVISADKRFRIRTDRDTARLEICYIGTFIGGKFKKSNEVTEARFNTFDNLPLIPKDQMLMIAQALKIRSAVSYHQPQPLPLQSSHPPSLWNRLLQRLQI